MRNRGFIRTAALFLSAALMLCVRVRADGTVRDALLDGKAETPLTVTVSEPAYRQIARFGTDRTDSLNRVLKHLSLSVTLDGELSETVFSVDGDLVFSYLETAGEAGPKRFYSFDPDTAYVLQEDAGRTDLSGLNGFLEDHFFPLNRLLDDLYPVFEKAGDAFAEFGKSASVSLSFRGYGKGVRQTTISLSGQYVGKRFPAVAAGLAETDECKAFLQRLIFKGPQKIMLLYDQEDRLLRIRYDGEAGFSEESMRNVSVSWRCVRNGEEKKDNLTLKTPAKKGSDRYNLTYEREISLAEQTSCNMKWDLQIDLKTDTVRKKISYAADLTNTAGELNGKITWSDKEEGIENRIEIVPAVKKENDAEYAGTIEITNNSGKIITSCFTVRIRISPAAGLAVPSFTNEYQAGISETDAEDADNTVLDRLNSILIRKLLTLPQEDLGFFSTDIPAEDWNSLVQSF